MRRLDSEAQYSAAKKEKFVTKVFCWIEAGNTEQVVKFFDTFPQYLTEFSAPNNASLIYYAVRYGNLALVRFFQARGLKIDVKGENGGTMFPLVHAAIISGDVHMLRYLLDLGLSPCTVCSDLSALKSAMKLTNQQMIEQLVARGAYFTIGDVCHNFRTQGEKNAKRFYSLETQAQISNQLIVDDYYIRECFSKEVLRWARIRPLLNLCRQAQEHLKKKASQPESGSRPPAKFDGLARILANEKHKRELIKLLVHRGNSILVISKVAEPTQHASANYSRESSGNATSALI